METIRKRWANDAAARCCSELMRSSPMSILDRLPVLDFRPDGQRLAVEDRSPGGSKERPPNTPDPLPPPVVPVPDYEGSIEFPRPLPDGLPDPAPCPTCHLGLFWLDAYENLHCYDCTPPPNDSLAARRLFVMIDTNEGAGNRYEWRDFDWMRKYPPAYKPVAPLETF
jgi:hypothetical protein